MIIILFLSANPKGTKKLELIKECNLITQKIRSAPGREFFKLEQRHDISIKWLIDDLLNYNPQILHFSGHGSERSALIFKDEKTGRIEEVPPSALSNLFKVLGKKIDLVFLNACYSEKQARAIAEHVNCVIGMSDAIHDSTAIEFASTFYSSLGFRKSIKEAFDLAKVKLELLSIPGVIPKLIIKEGIDPSKIFIFPNPILIIQSINSLTNLLSNMGTLDKIRSEISDEKKSSSTTIPLENTEKEILKDLSHILKIIADTYRSIDDAIIKLSTLSFDNKDDIKMSEEFLKKVQGGRLKIELEEARFHCTEIKAMYNKGIKKWIEDLKYQDKIDDYEHNSLHILFNEYLPDSDNIIIRSIENLNNEASNSADIILEALYNRNIKIAESEVNNISHKLAIHRKQLSEEIIKLQKLRNEFLELVMNF